MTASPPCQFRNLEQSFRRLRGLSLKAEEKSCPETFRFEDGGCMQSWSVMVNRIFLSGVSYELLPPLGSTESAVAL